MTRPTQLTAQISVRTTGDSGHVDGDVHDARDQEYRGAGDGDAGRRAHDHVQERQREEHRQRFVHVGERARRALADHRQRPHVIAISEVLASLPLAPSAAGSRKRPGQQSLQDEQRKH